MKNNEIIQDVQIWEKLDSAVRSELGSEVNLNQDLEINILLSGSGVNLSQNSLDPRPIRLQLNARSPTRPGVDCIWA